MPRAVTIMLTLAGVALAAAALTTWRGGPASSPLATGGRSALGLPATLIGTSALSHGTSASARDRARPTPDPCPPTTVLGAAVERSDGSRSTPCASDTATPSRK